MAARISERPLESAGPASKWYSVTDRSYHKSAAIVRATLFLLVLLMSWAAAAHHSVGVFYEPEAASEVSGTITSVAWFNPHIRFTLQSINGTNEPEIWAVESGSVNMLERNGISRDQLAVGSEVTVVGRGSRLGRKAIYATAISKSGGATVALQGQFGEPEAASAGLLDAQRVAAGSQPDGIFRVWTRGRAYGDAANDIATGLELPYTAAALAARDRYNPLTDDTALACIPQGMPGIMDNPFPIEFAARDGDILLRLEEWDVERTIHLTGDPAAEAQPATPLGYSVGHWEDDTLVVETTRIDWPFFDDVGTPQSAAIETVERFSLSADQTRLSYSITATDPATFTAPVTVEGYWVWVPGQEIKPYNCTL